MAYQFVSEDACPKTPLRKASQVTDYKTQKIYDSNAHKALFVGRACEVRLRLGLSPLCTVE